SGPREWIYTTRGRDHRHRPLSLASWRVAAGAAPGPERVPGSATRAPGKFGQLAIEPCWLLEVRQVADAVVPGGFGGGAGGEDVFGHCRKHDSVGPALCDEHGGVECAQYVVLVDFTRGEVRADRRRNRHVPAERGLQRVLGEWLGGDLPDEDAQCADVGRQVICGQVGEVIKEAGADQRAEGRWAELDGCFHEVDCGDALLAVFAYVVADDERAVGPAHEH